MLTAQECADLPVMFSSWVTGPTDSQELGSNVKPMLRRLNPSAFDKRLYRRRNLVERFFNKLKHFRAVATRYDKGDDNHLASVKLASIRIWLRFNESVT